MYHIIKKPRNMNLTFQKRFFFKLLKTTRRKDSTSFRERKIRHVLFFSQYDTLLFCGSSFEKSVLFYVDLEIYPLHWDWTRLWETPEQLEQVEFQKGEEPRPCSWHLFLLCRPAARPSDRPRRSAEPAPVSAASCARVQPLKIIIFFFKKLTSFRYSK